MNKSKMNNMNTVENTNINTVEMHTVENTNTNTVEMHTVGNANINTVACTQVQENTVEMDTGSREHS